MPLVEYFKNNNELKLTGVFALVDSLMLAHDYNYGERLIPKLQENHAKGKRDTLNLLVEQILFCSHLILTKGDRIENEKLPTIASHIQAINPHVSAHSVLFGKLQLESLFDIQEYNYFKVEQLIDELKPILEAEEKGEPKKKRRLANGI